MKTTVMIAEVENGFVVTVTEESPEGYVGVNPYGKRVITKEYVCVDDDALIKRISVLFALDPKKAQ